MADKVEIITFNDHVNEIIEFRIRIPRNAKMISVFDAELQQKMKDAIDSGDNLSFIYGIKQLVSRMEC